MDQIATPALDTPIGNIVILIMGFVFAVGLWTHRESVDLLFFRLSGQNAGIGRLAALVVPLLPFVAAVLFALHVL